MTIATVGDRPPTRSGRLTAVTRHPGLTPLDHVARRVVRGGVIWGGALGLMTFSIVNQYATQYPTPGDREMLVTTMGADAGSRAIFGPARGLDTVAGYEAYHVIAIFAVVGAVWGLLAATRALRGEEDAGRWELLLAGPTTRRGATAATLAGLGVGLFTFWAVSAASVLVIGRTADPPFAATGSLFTALAATSAAAMFMAVGALCSQLAASRRQAATWATVVFGLAFLIRAVAYSDSRLEWLRWISPLAWIDELRPLTDSRPLVLAPMAATVTALVAATILLAGRRDLGTALLLADDTAPARTRFLNGPLGLAYRLDRRTALGWLTGIGAGGLVLGVSTESVEDIWRNNTEGVVTRLGGASGGDAYLGVVFLVVALMVTMAAAGQVTATREEEAEGYLDHLLARPVARLPWLVARLAVSIVALTAIGALAGVAVWVTAAGTGADVSLPSLLAAGLNAVPAGVVVLGVGTLAFGLAPRLATVAAYGLVAWSFLVEIVGNSIGAGSWLMNTSILHHIARAPAADVRWDSAAVLVALGLAAAAAGVGAFVRRDLKGG